MESPYALKKHLLTEKLRSASSVFRDLVEQGAKQPFTMILPDSDTISDAHINLNAVLAYTSRKFCDAGRLNVGEDRHITVTYLASSNLQNGQNGGQATATVSAESGGLFDQRRTAVMLGGDRGGHGITMAAAPQQISMNCDETYDNIIKAFGWNRNESANMPAYNRNLSALLRQSHNGVNLATRIIKLMCYYFVSLRTGRIRISLNQLNRFQIIGYNYASIGNASVVDDCAYSYCSDPHNAYVYAMHALGMSQFPTNDGHAHNDVYRGLVIPADAANLKIVIPEVNEVGMPNNVEMTSKMYLCALNSIMIDYQIGDLLAETLWGVACGLLAHNAMCSVTLPRVNSLAMLCWPIWNPVFNVPKMIREVDLQRAVGIAYTCRATLWAGVNTILSAAMRGKQSYDGMAPLILQSVHSRAHRLYVYTAMQPCLSPLWQIISWVDGMAGMSVPWLDAVRQISILESYWVVDANMVISQHSVYDALCHGTLLRRSEDYSSSNGQRAGATGICLGILAGTVYSSNACQVTGHGANYGLRNLLCEGLLTCREYGIVSDFEHERIQRQRNRLPYQISLDFEPPRDIPLTMEGNEEDSDEEEDENDETSQESIVENPPPLEQQPEVNVPVAKKPAWRPSTRVENRREEREQVLGQAKTGYLNRMKLPEGVSIKASEVVLSGTLRYFRFGDKTDLRAEVSSRKGIAKLFTTLDWRYPGADRDVRLLSTGAQDVTPEGISAWQQVVKLLPPIMAELLEAGIEEVFAQISNGAWPAGIRIPGSRTLHLWKIANNISVTPEFNEVQDDQYHNMMTLLEEILIGMNMKDAWNWLIAELKANAWH